jgi:hypothetical protein
MLWKRIDFDKWKWYQCIDLFKDYMFKVLGIKIITSGNAKDVRTNKYKVFDNTWQKIPWTKDLMQWDIIVSTKWTYWHIAIVDKVLAVKPYVLEQNWSWIRSGNWLWANAIRVQCYEPSFRAGVRRCKKIFDNLQKERLFIDKKIQKINTDVETTLAYKNSIRYLVPIK